MSSEHRYGHADEKYEVELNRLRLQARIFDPVTTRHLETIGVAAGWSCLEVGAGAGSVAQWLSKRVGPNGKVVATDIDLKFLDWISAPNLEVRRHDILRDDLEAGKYDLVHCRKLLMHLPEPEKALNKMVESVKPGGWLLVEEDDYGSILSLDVTDPSLATIAALIRGVYASMRERGIMEPYFGRRVRGLVEQLGFVDVAQEGWTYTLRGGDPMTRTMAVSGQAFARTGSLTQEWVEGNRRMSSDPTLYYPGLTMFSAWGRKPSVGKGT
jgi:ubiquinone/menaquinone biosynthesis C-methylase UbiE